MQDFGYYIVFRNLYMYFSLYILSAYLLLPLRPNERRQVVEGDNMTESDMKEYVRLYKEFSDEVDKVIPRMQEGDRLTLFAIALKDMRAHNGQRTGESEATKKDIPSLAEVIDTVSGLTVDAIQETDQKPNERQKKMLYAKLHTAIERGYKVNDISDIMHKASKNMNIFETLVEALKAEGC